MQERFFEVIPLQSATSESIVAVLREHPAATVLEDQKTKLIYQDGASVMRGATAGFQRKIKDVYPNAYRIYCYVHQLNLIMQQATSHISKVRIFFLTKVDLPAFFQDHQSARVLDKMVARRLPTSSNIRWNFHSRAYQCCL